MAIYVQRRCLAFAPLFLMLVATTGLPAQAAISVSFEKVARTGDPVPGRESLGVVFNGRARQPSDSPGVLSIPSINDSDEVAFMARSSQSFNFNVDSAIGIYAKSPGSPLRVLADTGVDAAGNPVFAVPGQPAGTFFASFDPPLINNRGDVVFRAIFSGGSGFYATTTAGGPLVKIVDSTDQVPGAPGVTFNGFFFSGFNPRILIWLNDVGQVVFMGRFKIPTQQFEDQGLYGTTVAGGAFHRLVDTTETVIPANETVPFRGLSQTNFPAINNNGDVIFQGGIGAPPPATLLDGIFVVPVDGTAAPTTIARRGQLAPTLSDGNLRAFFSTWAGQDINDAGDFLISHNFFRSGFSAPQALFTGNMANPTAPLTLVMDNVGGFAAPGQPAGTILTGASIAAINASGQMGFFARDNGPISNAQGIYAASLTGPPFAVVSHNGDVPPGQVAPASIADFKGASAPINASGNMVLDPSALNVQVTDLLFGLYFYNTCTQTLERILDRDTVAPPLPTGLGASFTLKSPGLQRFLRVRDGQEVRAGQFRAINNNDSVTFLAAFNTFDVGIYIAHVTAGGGALAIVCPADALLLPCPADTSPAALGSATASGCGAVTVGSTDVITPGCGNTEAITRTWTADDGTGNIVSCTQTITTQDTTSPGLTIPADSTIECSEPTDPSNTGQASATDTCDSAPAFTFTDAVVPGVCGQASVITRTWTATDACGNSTSADQIITLRDTTPPSLTIPGDVIVECGTSTTPAATGQATATDNCDAAPMVTFQETVTGGTCPQGSVITRTWTASDACGNSVSAVQTITVLDTTPPVLTVPADVSVECDADSSPQATGSATASDNCDITPTVSHSDAVAPGVCPQASVITRTWTATDACGHAASAIQTIHIADTTSPVVTLNGAGTVVLTGCVGDAYVEPGATAIDNCDAGPLSVAIGGDTVNTSLPATFTILYNAQDACGNLANQVTRTVIVKDTTAPTFTSLPPALTTECQAAGGVPASNAVIAAFLNMATASDACDPVVNISNSAPAIFPLGVTTTTWTATDIVGNSFTASRMVTVVDTTPPAVSCPPAVTAFADGVCQAIVPDVTGQATATDTCSNAASLVATQSPPAGTVLGLGIHTITVNVADGSGNSSQCSTMLTVIDDTAPTIVPPPAATIECDQPTDPASTGTATVVDNCTIAPAVTFSDSVTSGTCPELSSITRTWTATDSAGNSIFADQTISVVDTTAAAITCPSTISLSGGFGGALVNFSPTAIDACDPSPSIMSMPPSGSFFTTGFTSVTASATDTCANMSTCSLDVLVSCFGVNRAKIGIQDSSCRGIESIELRSYNGTEELISLFKAEHGQGGGIREDVLPASLIVNDGINGTVTIDTSCAQPMAIGDVFGPYTVVDIKQDFDDSPGSRGNEVELRGSFVPAVPFDLALDDVTFTIDDGGGHSAAFTIPAGSFQPEGKPEKKKFEFEGPIGIHQIEAKFENCEFKFEAKDVNIAAQFVGTILTVRLEVGLNVGQDTLAMEDKGNHLKFKRRPKVECCPKCEGLASLQVTSNQKVLVFTPGLGQTKLPANTLVDDGVNGPVTIHTSCSQAINVGDVFGPYTVSEVVKIFNGSSHP